MNEEIENLPNASASQGRVEVKLPNGISISAPIAGGTGSEPPADPASWKEVSTRGKRSFMAAIAHLLEIPADALRGIRKLWWSLCSFPDAVIARIKPRTTVTSLESTTAPARTTTPALPGAATRPRLDPPRPVVQIPEETGAGDAG